VLLLFGEQSRQANPYLRYRQPELAWRRAFTDYRVDVIAGCHGELFDRDASLDSLSGRLRHHLERAIGVDARWSANAYRAPVVTDPSNNLRPILNGPREVLTRADCRQVLEAWPEHRLAPSNILRNQGRGRSVTRTSRQVRLTEPLGVVEVVRAATTEVTGLPPEHQEPINLLCYKPGEYFRLHHDQPRAGSREWTLLERNGGRRVTSVGVGITGDYDGGRLVFPDLEREIHLGAGQMPWWRDDLPVVRHEVRPVTAGLRFALALFVRERRYDASEDSGQVY